MTSFAYAMDFLFSQEGGLVDDARDPGGITNYGISLRFAESVKFDGNADTRTDALDIKGLSPADAIALYRQHFWLPIKGDELPRPIAIAVFDMAVNQGVKTAIRCLQKTLRLNEDGVIGPKTLQAANNAQAYQLLLDFLSHRLLRYAATKNFDRFGRGWCKRSLALLGHILTTVEGVHT